MRVWLVAVLVLLGCEKTPSGRYDNSVNVDTRVAPPTQEQVTAANTTAKPAETSLSDRIADGKVTDDDVKLLLEQAAKNRAITYAHLKKSTDRYKGDIWRFRGKILEIAESKGTTRARIALDSYGQKAMLVEAPFETEFVEGNRVEVLGVLAGAYSYTSQAGWNITIPAMLAARITKPKEPKPLTLNGLQMLRE